jgi:hypothetical protein
MYPGSNHYQNTTLQKEAERSWQQLSPSKQTHADNILRGPFWLIT